MKIRALLVAASLVALALPAQPQFPASEKSAQSSARGADSVRFLFPDQVALAAKKPGVVELHFRVADGMHINSHTPHSKLLIPTNFVVAEKPGVNVSAVDFPAGADYSFSFSPKEKLSVYAGEFVLKAHVTAQPGQHLVEAVLRYQACDSNSCYPPKTIPVVFNIAAK
ncbi:MAG TPA: protein-disulfide reductase DsbD domain-containing protein [Acidisarcina sp.]|nr:protein-disulfide reductase DsbD domain-containing protein [Acidisarcina sp.]